MMAFCLRRCTTITADVPRYETILAGYVSTKSLRHLHSRPFSLETLVLEIERGEQARRLGCPLLRMANQGKKGRSERDTTSLDSIFLEIGRERSMAPVTTQCLGSVLGRLSKFLWWEI